MIKEIFLPEKIGSHRILAQNIIGLSLHEDSVRLALVYAKRGKTVVEDLITEPIQDGPEDTFADRAAQAIKKAVSRVKKYQRIRICIPASMVIFKELQLQFKDPEKIRMVLDYEIETMLPFAIEDAVVDFIITKSKKDEPGAQVLVAAVRNQDLEQYLTIFEKAEIEPSSITIDLFSIYGLYQQIPEYKNLPHATALVDVGMHATRIAFVQHGQLRLTRYIQRGLGSIIKLMSEETKIPAPDIEQKLLRGGIRALGDDALIKAAQKHFVLLLNDIQFTLNSFSLKLNFYEGITKVLFTGYVSNIADFMTFCSDTMQIPCEVFNCKKIFENKTVKNKIKHPVDEWHLFAMAMGTALPPLEQDAFDLRRKQFALQRHGLIGKQLATASVLTIFMLLSLCVKGYFDLHGLQSQIDAIEQREVNRIKSEGIFPKNQFPKNPTLANVVRDGERIVRDKLTIWAPFAQQRMRPLSLWFEVTRIINKKQFDVTIKEVVFTTQAKGWERERGTGTKPDAGIPKVEIDGFFSSKTGNHFVDFATLESRFKDSALLRVCEPETQHLEATTAEGGVNFEVRMKAREV